MSADPEVLQTVRLRIPSMDCATEEAEIRKALDPIDGIRSVRFQLAARTIEITASQTRLVQVVETIRSAGFHPEALPSRGSAANVESRQDGRRELMRLSAALVLAIFAEGIAYFGGDGMHWRALESLCAVAAIAQQVPTPVGWTNGVTPCRLDADRAGRVGREHVLRRRLVQRSHSGQQFVGSARA